MTKSKKRPTLQQKVQYEIVEEGKATTKKPKVLVKTNTLTTCTMSNIILHLRCTMKELEELSLKSSIVADPLEYRPSVPPEIAIKAYHKDALVYGSLLVPTDTASVMTYDDDARDGNTDLAYQPFLAQIPAVTEVAESAPLPDTTPTTAANTTDLKNIQDKLKKLKLTLFKNMLGKKRSACFWCTCDFDTEECHIPKYFMEDQIYGYGSFCRPECAAAFLMKEDIDDSMKFERYHLLNHIYGGIFGYEKSVKPAPNPYYTLDKYYGNMTVQEYRALLASNHKLIVLEKPLTRMLPELHEDGLVSTGASSKGALGSTTGTYKVKRPGDKQGQPSKVSMLREHFGLS